MPMHHFRRWDYSVSIWRAAPVERLLLPCLANGKIVECSAVNGSLFLPQRTRKKAQRTQRNKTVIPKVDCRPPGGNVGESRPAHERRIGTPVGCRRPIARRSMGYLLFASWGDCIGESEWYNQWTFFTQKRENYYEIEIHNAITLCRLSLFQQRLRMRR